MKRIKTTGMGLLAAGMVMAGAGVVRGQYSYTVNYPATNTITITGYTGTGGVVNITNKINGLTVTSIGNFAFNQCSVLTSITIPNSVTGIGDYAFINCSIMTNATISTNVASIGNYVFADCSMLSSIIIPYRVTGIGNFAFYGCSILTNVTIPNGVTNIGDEAFYGCWDMTSVTIGNSVTNIGNEAFWNCYNLTSVTIPDTVTSIGNQVFEYCYGLTSAYFEGNAPTNDGTLFESDPTTIYYLPGTTGWSNNFAGCSTALWCPKIFSNSIQSTQFCFNINWANGMVTVVEASTNLLKPTWTPLQTNTMISNTVCFSDPNWKNYRTRFYRVVWQ